MKTNIIGIVAAAGIGLLALNIPGIQIHHHVDLPTLNKYRIVQTEQVKLIPFPSVYQRTDITLEQEIRGPVFYEDVGKVLRDAKAGDQIVFHLSGYGGNGDTMYQMLTEVHNSKASITMSVEGPVYSAHAYLAVAGDKLVMTPYSFLMFHSISLLGETCDSAKGKLDRGHDAYPKCQQMLAAELHAGANLVNDAKVMTPAEKATVLQGFDVYITYEEAQQRGVLSNDK